MCFQKTIAIFAWKEADKREKEKKGKGIPKRRTRASET